MLGNKLLTQLKDAQHRSEQLVIRGNAQDLAQYKFLVGQIRAFEEAIEMCRKLLKESGEIDE